jgi:hypothetical protein
MHMLLCVTASGTTRLAADERLKRPLGRLIQSCVVPNMKNLMIYGRFANENATLTST